jgi:hypothetical protein
MVQKRKIVLFDFSFMIWANKITFLLTVMPFKFTITIDKLRLKPIVIKNR